MNNHKRVLIVDDEEPIRELVARVLERESFEVELARDGQEAIEKLAACDYDVVVLDLMMPRRNGFDVIEEIRRRWPARLDSVIVTTALAVAASESLRGTVKRILPKPFDLRDLISNANGCAWIEGAAE